jgi:hypothetical protein
MSRIPNTTDSALEPGDTNNGHTNVLPQRSTPGASHFRTTPVGRPPSIGRVTNAGAAAAGTGSGGRDWPTPRDGGKLSHPKPIGRSANRHPVGVAVAMEGSGCPLRSEPAVIHSAVTAGPPKHYSDRRCRTRTWPRQSASISARRTRGAGCPPGRASAMR